jgi:hypothetical protein
MNPNPLLPILGYDVWGLIYPIKTIHRSWNSMRPRGADFAQQLQQHVPFWIEGNHKRKLRSSTKNLQSSVDHDQQIIATSTITLVQFYHMSTKSGEAQANRLGRWKHKETHLEGLRPEMDHQL